MNCSHHDHYSDERLQYVRHGRKPVSEKMRFYKHLRSFLIVNTILFFLAVSGRGGFGWIEITMIWGIFVAFHYMKVYGLPGTKGWFGEDWRAWMEERERTKKEDQPEPLYYEESGDPQWRKRDMV